MSAGAHFVSSRAPPVEELIEDGKTGQLVGVFDVEGWRAALIKALAEPSLADQMRVAPRRKVRESDGLRRGSLPRMISFVETAGANRGPPYVSHGGAVPGG